MAVQSCFADLKQIYVMWKYRSFRSFSFLLYGIGLPKSAEGSEKFLFADDTT